MQKRKWLYAKAKGLDSKINLDKMGYGSNIAKVVSVQITFKSNIK